jgi:methylmalonyl-CoA mutase
MNALIELLTILPEEIKDLIQYGITRIYSPDDGRAMGLQGMINDLVMQADYPTGAQLQGEEKKLNTGVQAKLDIARLISAAENYPDQNQAVLNDLRSQAKSIKTPVLGITGTGGAGKSSLVDELERRFLAEFPEMTIQIMRVLAERLNHTTSALTEARSQLRKAGQRA